MIEYVASIDPGVNGAIAIFKIAKSFKGKQGKLIPIQVYDMPRMIKLTGKGEQIDPIGLRKILIGYKIEKVFLELITAMHQQGATSAFNFGGAFHTIIGVAIGLGLPIYFIPPKKWRNCGVLAKTDKKGALLWARKKWPILAKSLALVKHQDRADALWIGYVGYKLQKELKKLII